MLPLAGFLCGIVSFHASANPTISTIPDQRTFRTLSTRPISFVIGDDQSGATNLILTGVSSNLTLVANSNIVFGGFGSNRTVTITPSGVKGTNLITLAVQNSLGSNTVETFQLTIADFTDIGANLQQLDDASVAWGDYDNDGFLDLLVTGSSWVGYSPGVTKIYRNNGNGTFTDTGATLQGVIGGGAVWGDYNNDGRLDVMLTGLYNASWMGFGLQANVAQRVCRNDGSNTFTTVAAFENPNGGGGFQGLRTFSLAWGDYDNDGKLDLVIMGWPFSVFKHNEGGDSFSSGSLGLPGVFNTAVAWADYNSDGNLDFFLNAGYPKSLYQNNGGGIFITPTNNLPALSQGLISWEDYNNDGNFDLVMVGSTNSIYVGDGHGNFTNLPVILPGGNLSAVAWGDIDNDGLPDLVITSYAVTQILHNNGDGAFSDMGITLPGAGNGGVAIGDFNEDGCLDIAIAGGGITKIFRNDGAMQDAPPNSPLILDAAPTTNLMMFGWLAATDAEQNGGLSYSLRVGTSPGGVDVVSPMSDPITGFRRLPAPGNCGLRLNCKVTRLVAGTYYWSVQAIDHAFMGSAFASEQSFTLTAPYFSSQPQNQTNILGATVSFTVNAGGTSPFSFRWYHNGTNVTDNGHYWGSTTSSLMISNAQASDVGNFTVMLANLTGSITSSVATATILNPLITTQPQNTIAWTGGTSTFSVNVSGQQPLSYQWQLNGTNIVGATENILALNGIQPSQFGNYSVVITNIYGSITSSVVTLFLSQIAVWGYNLHGETNLPAGLTNIIAISGGGRSFFVSDCQALKSDGTVIRWPGGANISGTNNLVALAGASPSLGLKVDGTIIFWDYNFSQPSKVSGFSNIVAIAPRTYNYLALMTNGTVVGGASVPGLTNIVAIAEGIGHSLALKADGTVLAWGNDSYGQIDVPPGLSNVICITAGYWHSLAVKSDGTVVGWGQNDYGQAVAPTGLSNVIAIAAGAQHSLALRGDGTVASWGLNNYGQTNVPAGMSNVTAIAAGQYHSMALIGNGPPILQVPMINPIIRTNNFSLSFPTRSGRVYLLQYKNSLGDTDWTSSPLTAGNGGIVTLKDNTATNTQRFYRVLQW